MQLGSGVRLGVGSRREKRHLTSWRAYVSVQGRHNYQEETYPARVYDISMEGATLLVERNLACMPATLTLAVPPKTPGAPIQVRVKSRLVYTLLGSDGQFRAGIDFEDFHGDGKRVLEEALNARVQFSG